MSTSLPRAPSPASSAGRGATRPGRRRPSRARWRAALLLAPAGLLLAPAVGLAHPFGPPPRSWLTVEGATVVLSWEAAYDDYLAVGEHLGHFATGTAEAYLDPSVQVAPPREDVEALADSEDLHAYLERHIVVEQDGQRCEPEILTAAFFEQGAETRHRCPSDPDELTVRISMLHDLNDAYRTFGLAEDGAAGPYAIFSVEEPEHRVAVRELTGEPALTARLPLLAALLVVVASTVVGFRRLTRRERHP